METLQVQTLWQIMELLRSTNQLGEALSGSLEILMRATDSRKGSLWMKDEQSGRAIALIVSGTKAAAGESAGPGDGVVGKTLESGESLLLKKADSENIKIAGEDSPALNDASLLCIPLKTSKHTIGCLLLSGKTAGDYTEEDQKTCEGCCSVLAVDLEKKGFSFRPFEDREPVVTARGITKEFMNGAEICQILKGIDLDVYPGELVVVLGESGCGKSTLLNIIGGMDVMTSGRLVVNGVDMSASTEKQLTEYRRECIGFIFQSYHLMPNLSAYENVEFIGEISNDPMDSMEALRMVGLEDKADNMPSALSGGEMQRVSIARALVKKPKIILADEPTAALDYNTSIRVLGVIEEVVKQSRTTVLLVTHNPEIAKMANRVIKLRDGRISSIRVNLEPLKAEDLVW